MIRSPSLTTTAALMPGTLSALSKLMLVIFAAAHLERRIMPYSQPSAWMSEEYRAWPVNLALASTRHVRWLMCFVSLGQLRLGAGESAISNHLRVALAGGGHAGGLHRRLHDARIRAATADVPDARVPHLFGGGM